jgi:O-antigen ligase
MGPSATSIVSWARHVLLAVLLVTTFVTTCWAGPVGVYLALVAGLLSVFLFDTQAIRFAIRDRGVQCVLIAFVTLSAAFVIGARKQDDGMAFVDFLALPVLVPAYALLQGRASPKNVVLVAALATIGSLVAIATGFYDVNFRQLGRAAGGTSPIFFSDMAVLLGYFALLGMLVWKSHWRWTLALGNALAVGAALYGGTRGAIVTEIAVLITFCAYALVWWDRPWRTRLTTALGVVAITVLFSVTLFDMSRTATIFVTAGEAATVLVNAGETVTDSVVGDVSANIRLKFWAAGLQSFLESPIYGHSWWNRFEAAIPYMPPDIEREISRDKTAHLHNDIINFASGAGMMGVSAYLLLLAAPLVSAWSSPRNQRWQFRVFAASGLSMAYFVMGLTDTMFVFEIPKSMFVLCSAVIMAFFLDAPPGQVAQAAPKAAEPNN